MDKQHILNPKYFPVGQAIFPERHGVIYEHTYELEWRQNH